ncbi:hypothetical protein E2320_007724, partial [Naja naja]
SILVNCNKMPILCFSLRLMKNLGEKGIYLVRSVIIADINPTLLLRSLLGFEPSMEFLI